MNREDIIKRIKNLQKITKDNGASEGEILNAATLIQQILIKHSIEMSEVEGTEFSDEEKVQEHDDTDHPVGKFANWKRDLMNVLCKHYFCDAIMTTSYMNVGGKYKKAKFWKLVGKQTNTTITFEMYYYLIDVIVRLSYDGYYENGKNKLYGSSHIYLDSWRSGCVERIDERLTEMRTKNMESNSCTAIQIANVYEKEFALVNGYVNKMELTFVKRKSRLVNNSAWSDGYDRGDDVGLDTQVGANKAPKNRRLETA